VFIEKMTETETEGLTSQSGKPAPPSGGVKGWLKRNWVPLVCITIAVAGILLVLLLFIRPCVPTPQALVENLPCNQSCFYELGDTFVPKDAPLAAKDGGCMDDACAGRLCDLVYAAQNRTSDEGRAAMKNLTKVYSWIAPDALSEDGKRKFINGKHDEALVECEKRRACPRDDPDTSADERALDPRVECGCCLTSTNTSTATTTKPLQRRIQGHRGRDELHRNCERNVRGLLHR